MCSLEIELDIANSTRVTLLDVTTELISADRCAHT